MPLSWNEIKDRALRFSLEWKKETRERAETQTFWNEFFQIFGISRRRLASFEAPVRRLDDSYGFIDLFWKGVLLVEHKSRGRSLDKAYDQSMEYFQGIKENELPKYVIVSDFANFRLYDLDEDIVHEFELEDLVNNVHLFGFIAGYQTKKIRDQDPVNIEAAKQMGKLHDKLKENGYTGHALEVYLVRLLFCMFADDTNIFDKNIFLEYIENKTNEDGSDLGYHLTALFQTLNIPKDKRQTTLDESLMNFPYINGSLFDEILSIATFNSEMREILIDCCLLDWSKISPAIFGSLFQSVMDPEERRSIGGHYTSEKNILKLIKPLFLDELWKEFDSVKGNFQGLNEFHDKIANLKFLDPACGCGNFLVITYRELRLLELEIIKILLRRDGGIQQVMDIKRVSKIDVDSFYGIEIEEFPVRIAEVSMWMIDHLINMELSFEFGLYYVRLPLKKSAEIIIENALRKDWNSILPDGKFSYILGNPPFVGKQHQTASQKEDMREIFDGVTGRGVLDYVTAWYIKAAKYIQDTDIKVAFVSTNSISQGEQVGILWNQLYNRYNIKIHFAHSTFKWSSEATNAAAVYVVIIGFANFDIDNKLLYNYSSPNSNPHEIDVNNINPYLVEGDDIVILKRRNTLCDVPSISFGNMPNEGGNLILSDLEKEELLNSEPNAEKFIKPLISARQFINGENRWCLWLVDADPNELRRMPEVMQRIESVHDIRIQSRRAATKRLAETPTLFGEIRQPESDYVLIPRHSSENRKYIPLGYFNHDNIVSDSCSAVENATMYHFGVLMSSMHMTWVSYVCGKLEGRYRYSNEIVYNNFPWPENQSQINVLKVKSKAKKVLDARKKYPNSTLADLYDPLTMPGELVKAHRELNKAVDSCYRNKKFENNIERIEYLFNLYNDYSMD